MCPEYQRLTEAYGQAVQAFSDAMRTLNAGRWKPGFHLLLVKAEQAKLTAQAARLTVELHLSEHGCGSQKAPSN